MHAAVIGLLSADPDLRALMPDGVFKNRAPGGSKRFVLVDVFDSGSDDVQGGRGIETVLYAVRAVALSSVTTQSNANAAADRIDALLADPPPVTVDGYAFMALYRDEPHLIDFDEVDKIDSSISWFHRGAHYRLECTPLA
jgi:hypothetical protein